jgi:hypothetical protein
MLTIQLVLATVILINLFWPQLPVSRAMSGLLLRFAEFVQRNATLGRALLGVSAALLLFAAIWALQGDAPMFLAMILPELAGWFATFEIATLVEAIVGIAAVYASVRVVSIRSFLRNRVGQRRRRSRHSGSCKASANDDDDGPRILAIAA